jgi:ferredoxin-NADP reductase
MAVAQKLRCTVEAITDHGEHVYTVVLRPERPAPRFRPGQFLHLALDEYEPGGFWPESRVFSIASGPAQRERLQISYSVRGQFTARMEQELGVGREVWVKLPYGDFVVEASGPVALLAGGTGITAFTAFLAGLTAAFPYPILLAYGARRRELLIYRDLVEHQRAAVPQLRPVYFLEEGAAHGDIAGRLAVAALWPLLAQPQATTWYLSGPPAMLQAVRGELTDLRVEPQVIKVDAWE